MIRVENLTKYYGKRLAVDNISFEVKKGEIVGFLGPNAAGKTTTMRMLTGFLAPTEGRAWIADCDVLTNSIEARQHIGYFAESVPLYTDMTVRGYLEFLGKLRGMDKNRIDGRVEDVVELCHLEEYFDVIIGKLSRGFRQRVGIAQAILHEPDVLIMDEPTVGIDPIQVSTTRNLIKNLGREHTILLSTHILPEVSVTCERVIIINEGRIVAEDRIENLSSSVSGSKRFKMEVQGPAKEIAEVLRRVKGVLKVQYDEKHFILETNPGEDPRSVIMQQIVKSGWTVLSLESAELSLEDVFLKLTTEEGDDSE